MKYKTRSMAAMAGAIVLAIIVFILDALTPLGLSEWVLYLLPMFFSVRIVQRWFPIFIAGLCTVFLMIGFKVAPMGIDPEMALGGRLLGVLVFWITALMIVLYRRVHDELRDSQAFHASLVEILPQSVLRKDREGRFIFGNKRFCDAIGKTPQQLKGLTDFDLFPKELAEKYRHDDQTVMEGGAIFDTIEEHMTPQGDQLFVQVVKTPVRDADNQIVGTQAIFWDVTDRKTAEEKLRKTAAELARSNVELEQFAYVASHDLQEPLRMVASYTQLLARKYTDKLDPTAHEFINFAVDGANRMQRLINDLLMYSRVGTRGGEFKELDSTSSLGQAVVNLQGAIQESGAIITNHDLPIIRADATQMVQLFQNLLANAVKFRGGESPRIHVSAAESECEWTFTVRDNGIGIDPQFADRIFVIFQRLHGYGEYPGTGIGLAVCKKIVERHGGRIWVESQPGAGATFKFTVTKQIKKTNDSTKAKTHEHTSERAAS